MPMGAQRVSQSRGQLVSHNKRPSGVSTSTQWVVGLYHSGGSSFCVRDLMVRPGLSRSHVRSMLIAPQSRILTVVPDAVILCFLSFALVDASPADIGCIAIPLVGWPTSHRTRWRH